MFDMADRQRPPSNITSDPEIKARALKWIEAQKPLRITFSNLVDMALARFLDEEEKKAKRKGG